LLLENGDTGINDGVFLISSVGFLFIEVSLLFEILLGSVDGEDGVIVDGVALSLLGDGSGESNQQLLEEVGISILVLVDIVGLSMGIWNPFSEGEGGCDFLFLEVSKGGFKLFFKVEEDIVDFLGNVITGLSILGGLELEELWHSLVVEQVTVLLELISNVGGLNLNEGRLSGKVST